MGCHTWFYKKVEVQPTYEELREKYLEHLKIEMGYYERHINGEQDEDEKYIFEDESIENSKYYLSLLQRMYRIVEKRLCKEATIRKASEVVDLSYCERNGYLYKDYPLHDVFRIGGYPEDELLSFEETIEFLDKNESKIRWGYLPIEIGKDAVIEKLKKFWNENPDGLITFG